MNRSLSVISCALLFFRVYELNFALVVEARIAALALPAVSHASLTTIRVRVYHMTTMVTLMANVCPCSTIHAQSPSNEILCFLAKACPKHPAMISKPLLVGSDPY